MLIGLLLVISFTGFSQDAPIGDSPMLFCISDSNTLEDVANQVTGTNLIFWDAPTGGSQLPLSTPLMDGMAFWVSQGVSGDRLEIQIIIDTNIDAPMASNPLQYCVADAATIEDVANQVTVGNNLIFWDGATGGLQLSQSTPLINGMTIWISQGVGSCASRIQINIIVVDCSQDSDGDTVPDMIDVDDDNDGIADVDENPNGVDPSADDDVDSVPNYLDDDPNDQTIGNDNGMIESGFDFDNDGIPNHFDIDADNDGIPDNVEAQTTIGYMPPTGIDSDGDGLDDAYDNFIIPEDTDGDIFPDFLDLDSDNDNIPDNIEGNDQNHDGVADNTPTGTDIDNDGLDDGYEGSNVNDQDVNDEINVPLTDLPDSDADAGVDGDVDYRDNDDDNDGILTSIEAAEVFRSTNAFLDTDGDSIPNYLDEDDDGDGVLTINEDYDGDGDPTNDDTNENGIPDYLDEDVALSTNENSLLVSRLYPSPTKGILTIEFDNLLGNSSIKIYSLQGKEVYTNKQQIQNNTTQIDVSNLSQGVYFIRLENENQFTIKKFLKE